MEGLTNLKVPQSLLAVLLGRPELESAELRIDLLDTVGCLDAFKGTTIIDILKSPSATDFQAHVRLSRMLSNIDSTDSMDVSEVCGGDRLTGNEGQVEQEDSPQPERSGQEQQSLLTSDSQHKFFHEFMQLPASQQAMLAQMVSSLSHPQGTLSPSKEAHASNASVQERMIDAAP